MLFFGGVVMRHRAVGIEGGNGVEAQRYIAWAAGTRSGQVFVNRQFGNALAAQGTVEPGKEFAQRRTILFHGLADMFRVCQALAGFGQCGGVEAFNQLDARVEVFQQAGSDAGGVYLQACARRYRSQRLRHLAVITQGHAILLKHRPQLRIDLAQRHKQSRLLLIDQGKGHKHRIERHISAAQVE